MSKYIILLLHVFKPNKQGQLECYSQEWDIDNLKGENHCAKDLDVIGQQSLPI